MIHSYEDFFTPEKCQHFINRHSELFNPDSDKRAFYHRETASSLQRREVVELSSYFTYDSKKLNGRLNFTVKNIDADVFVNYFQIVKWPMTEEQKQHRDFDYHPYTSIIYLNDNFEGGETVVEKTMIKPKKGLMVLFDGNKKVHSVNKINKGPRYTISCWYTK